MQGERLAGVWERQGEQEPKGRGWPVPGRPLPLLHTNDFPASSPTHPNTTQPTLQVSPEPSEIGPTALVVWRGCSGSWV